MTDTTTTIAAPAVPTTTITETTTGKPGWRTSEFYLALAAKLLGGAYAAGLIGDGGTVARIAGLAVVVLTYLGYSVSRGLAKAGGAAAVLVLVLAAGATQPACSWQQVKADTGAVAHGAVTCAKADVPAIKALGLQLTMEALASVLGGKGIPWPQIEAEAEAGAKLQGVAVGSCAFGQLIADLAKLLPPPAGQSIMARADDGRGELATLKAHLGVTSISLEGGQAL